MNDRELKQAEQRASGLLLEEIRAVRAQRDERAAYLARWQELHREPWEPADAIAFIVAAPFLLLLAAAVVRSMGG